MQKKISHWRFAFPAAYLKTLKIFYLKLFRLNVEGELSSGEHCFISDKNIIKNSFCLNYQGIWNPSGEWDYDQVKRI
jgi:hypothetical protein